MVPLGLPEEADTLLSVQPFRWGPAQQEIPVPQ